MATVLASTAAAIVGLWGVAHAIPTGQVLAGFKPITQDNRRIVLQEWMAEAFTMWGIAGVIATVTVVGGTESHASQWVYRIVAGLLIALAALTSVTGARTSIIWFKICPLLLTGSAALLVAATLV